MRVVSALIFAGVLGLTPAAFADGIVNDCKPNSSGGCACDDGLVHTCNGNDMAVPAFRDMAQPVDLAHPGDEGLDARREQRRRRNAASGRGLILLSGASALMVLALRRATRR